MELRPYQKKLYDDTFSTWDSGAKNILAVMATGAGKSVFLSEVTKNYPGRTCVIAHREELVSQLSLTLARNGVRHRLICPNKVIKSVVALHMRELSESFYDSSSNVGVAGVDTLTSKRGVRDFSDWCKSISLWIIDEAHHVLRKNKWGKAVSMFSNTQCKGLGVTATPRRTDGAGLGSHADGVFDKMLVGAQTRWLINNGYLTEYQIAVPTSSLDLSKVRVSDATGDFNKNDVEQAVAESPLVVPKNSEIIGDIVGNYQRFIKGASCIVFAPGTKTCHELEKQFVQVGIRAKALDSNTPDADRVAINTQFKNGDLQVLINVALFDEGYDVPSLMWVLDAYPTNSFGRYSQRFGRMLRLMGGKALGGYLDLAGNVARHNGPPDKPQQWSLDRRDKRAKSDNTDAEPIRVCANNDCRRTFPRIKKICPYCGEPVPIPTQRDDPEFVDGDITLLDAETLAKMRGDVDEVYSDVDEKINAYRTELQNKHMPKIGVMGHVKRLANKLLDRQDIQRGLREIMAQWAGFRRHQGYSDDEIFKDFYFRYQIDWLSAQSLYYDDAVKLSEKLTTDIIEWCNE